VAMCEQCRKVVLEPVLGLKTDRLDTGHPEQNTWNFSHMTLVTFSFSYSCIPIPDP
jgi:hypothetical protein